MCAWSSSIDARSIVFVDILCIARCSFTDAHCDFARRGGHDSRICVGRAFAVMARRGSDVWHRVFDGGIEFGGVARIFVIASQAGATNWPGGFGLVVPWRGDGCGASGLFGGFGDEVGAGAGLAERTGVCRGRTRVWIVWRGVFRRIGGVWRGASATYIAANRESGFAKAVMSAPADAIVAECPGSGAVVGSVWIERLFSWLFLESRVSFPSP
jgi:hypothetical protein